LFLELRAQHADRCGRRAGSVAQMRACRRHRTAGAVLRAAVVRYDLGPPAGDESFNRVVTYGHDCRRRCAIRERESLRRASLRTACVLVECRTIYHLVEHRTAHRMWGACDWGSGSADRNAVCMHCVRCGGGACGTAEMPTE
jgi:hypothetical protein